MLARFRLLLGAFFVTLTLVGCADTAAEEAGATSAAATDPTAAREAVGALERATEKKDETDARLSRALGRVGAMLTAEEQSAFTRAFNGLPDVVAIEGDYHAKARELATQLDAIAADPMATEQLGPRRLYEGYVLVAKTPEARSALVFAASALSKRLVLRGVSDEDVVDHVLAPALPSGFLRALLERGTKDAAVAETASVLEQGGDACRKIAGWLRRYEALDGNDMLGQSAGISTATTIQSLRTIAGLIAIWEIGSDLVAGDVNAALQELLDSGTHAVTGVAEGISLFRRLVLGVESSPLAEKIVKWSGKVAQGIAVVMNAIKLWNDAGKWHDSLNAKVRVVGDVVALGASILVLAGAGPIGPILATVALGIHWFADWLEDRRLAEQERADLAACLPAAGIDAALTGSMIDASPVLARTLARDVKLAPTDIRWILGVDPASMSEHSYTAIRFIGVQVAQIVFDLDATETIGMLKAAVGDEADPRKAEYKLGAFLRGIEYGPGFWGDLTRAQGLEWLRQEGLSEYVPDDDQTLRKAAFDGAIAYLAAR
ncbi:MAG: hypothetical protein KIT84_34515 [Labilithrix sp.]|nr:hypothetical protein [Labilithrix sp.]MCW5816162.1 hypothetical protein [Labilithrix sp.]